MLALALALAAAASSPPPERRNTDPRGPADPPRNTLLDALDFPYLPRTKNPRHQRGNYVVTHAGDDVVPARTLRRRERKRGGNTAQGVTK